MVSIHLTHWLAAVMRGDDHAEVMGMLLRAGADPMRPNLAGATPAMLSAPVKAHIRCYLVAGGSPVES